MWYFNGEEINDVGQFPENIFGFIYKITNLDNNKFYIGKKQLWFTRRRKMNKKELAARKDKRSSRYKQVKTESDWKTYTGSCKILNRDIEKGAEIKKEILQLAVSKKQLTYLEVQWQFKESVLEIDTYNENILGRFFREKE